MKPDARISFENDYATGCHPDVLAALIATNDEATTGYGLDPYCEAARALIREAIGVPDADVHFVVGGTQANALVADRVLRPWQGMLSAVTGHVNVHESGAIEATGHKVLVVDSIEGRLTAEGVDAYCRKHYDDPTAEHMVQPGMIYISQPTELGTLYSRRALRELRAVADAWHLTLYIDGARMASAISAATSDTDLGDIAEVADIFTIGGTKCGALFGEAIVVLRKAYREDIRSLIKQHGALLAKGRLLGVQFRALFEDGLYQRIGAHENRMGHRLAEGFRANGFELAVPPVTNQIFVVMDPADAADMAELAVFERTDVREDGMWVCRFVTSYATTPDMIDTLFARWNAR